MENKKTRWKDYLLLHGALFLYSTGSFYSKTAAGQAFLSPGFLLFYGLMLLNLLVYAVLWRQILKRFPLTVAFANKAVTILWGILWGALFFHETITWRMLVGAAVIILGVLVVVTDHE